MRHRIVKALVSMVFVAGASLYGDEAPKPTADDVKALGAKVADWRITHEKDSSKFKKGLGASRKDPLDWIRGALYAGMWEYGTIADTTKYADWLNKIGEANKYALQKNSNKYHADPHAVGQTWLNLYRRDKAPAMIEPTRKQYDWILATPRTGSLNWGKGDAHKRWGWCDALFMAPPVWARLAQITGEQKYLDFMHKEYMATYDLLWDKEEKLFWRDSSFFKKREKNGKKIFWSRGNGWVFGGLALMIPDLPKDWKHRAFYVDLFKTMAVTLKETQRADGTWSMGVLGSAKDYPSIETSGTGFFVFGLAWGINQGILDRATYEPAVLKGWQALSGCVDKDGLLGYVQPVGAAPGRSWPDKTEDYGIGAFLAASAEVYKLVGGVVPKTQAKGEAKTESKAPVAQKAAPEAAPCFARFVPERLDDFAWENDRIAFRMYGPALWKIPKQRCGGGVDVWVKKVRYPIINKWYKSGNYHKDTGEGADLYKVGKTLGCGGVGLWVADKLHLGGHYTTHKVITGSGTFIEFQLTYAPVRVGDVTVTEVKRISMTAGSNLFKCQSTFAVKGAESATIAIGVVRRKGKGDLQHGDNWLSYGEPANKKNGTTFCAVILPQKGEFKKTNGNAFLLVPVKDGQTVTYHAGAGWSKGLDFKTHAEWLTYVKTQAKELTSETK